MQSTCTINKSEAKLREGLYSKGAYIRVSMVPVQLSIFEVWPKNVENSSSCQAVNIAVQKLAEPWLHHCPSWEYPVQVGGRTVDEGINICWVQRVDYVYSAYMTLATPIYSRAKTLQRQPKTCNSTTVFQHNKELSAGAHYLQVCNSLWLEVWLCFCTWTS